MSTRSGKSKRKPVAEPFGGTAKKRSSSGPSAPASAKSAQEKFVSDVQVRQEAGTLKNGKLALGKTHIQEGKGSSLKLTRARFTLTG
jgi:hypothetical protein